MSSRHCDRCLTELEECPICAGSGRVSPFGDADLPCYACGSTGLLCPEHGHLWASLLPEKENTPVDDTDYDVDFGDPNPFVVPSGWLEQFSSINCRLGKQGTIEEQPGIAE